MGRLAALAAGGGLRSRLSGQRAGSGWCRSGRDRRKGDWTPGKLGEGGGVQAQQVLVEHLPCVLHWAKHAGRRKWPDFRS